MRMKFLVLGLLLFFLNNNSIAQGFNEQILKDSIINLSFNQLSRVDMITVAKKLIEKNKGVDPIIAEAVIYSLGKKKARNDLEELSKKLTENQLKDIICFMNSEAYLRLSSNEFSDALEDILITDIKGFFTNGESWLFNVSPLSDKNFNELSDKYLKLTNDVVASNRRVESLVLRLKNEMGIDDTYMITTITKQIQNNYYLYCKNVLVDYISKEQLQEIVEFYSQPYAFSTNLTTTPVRLFLNTIIENPKMFEKMIKDNYGSLVRIKDTTSIVRDYMTRLPNIPLYGRTRPIYPILTLSLKGKSTYTGQTRDGQPHGKGILTNKKGVLYSGYYKMGKRHGLVTTFYMNGDSITQMWVDDKVMEDQNTDIGKSVPLFKGEPMGYGFKLTNGIREEGLFVDGKLEGYAKRENIEDNIIEEGWYEKGVMTRGGIKTRNSENKTTMFEGEQFYSQRYGLIKEGSIIESRKSDGNDVKTIKTGSFIGSEFHGNGSIEMVQAGFQQCEKGYFSNGRLYGKGLKISNSVGPDNWICQQTSSGVFYQGELKNEIVYEEHINNISNIGTDYDAWTITRLGLEFSFGIPHQTANKTNADSLRILIKGEIRNDKLNGNAEVILSNGDYYRGVFVNGYFLNGNARITNKDRSIYEGGVISGRYEGDGKIIYADGTCDEGLYMFGAFVNGVRKDKNGEVLYNIRSQRLN